MSDPATSIATGTFRTSPRYELVLFDRLDEQERSALADLQHQPDFYGILRLRADAVAEGNRGAVPLRAVDHETALLLLTLREPGPLPAYAARADPSGDGVRRLVLDGVLEMSDGAAFASGAQAAARLLPAPGAQGRGQHRLGRISWEAIEYGAALDIDDRELLSMRLYAYNRIPLSRGHAARYPDAASILDSVADAARLRDAGWGVTGGRNGGWINFGRRRQRPGARPASHLEAGASYKLYVSPVAASIAEAFGELLEALVAHDVGHFKLAGSAVGLLRPDKLVAYFTDQETLMSVADRLGERLRGMTAHGVPFTAAIDGDGLLSWGVDPPAAARPLSWQPQQSWRSWISLALAGALLEARQGGADVPPARFAVQRLGLEGVDTERWAPSPTLWREPRSAHV